MAGCRGRQEKLGLGMGEGIVVVNTESWGRWNCRCHANDDTGAGGGHHFRRHRSW